MAPFRSMLLTLRGGPESFAPRAHQIPVYLLVFSTFLCRAFTAHRVAMIPMFLSSRIFLLLLPPETSGSQGNLQVREERGLLLQGHDGWPGLWYKAPHGQRRLIEQR